MVAFAQALQAEGLARGTVNGYLSALSAFYGYVVDIHEPQLATRNPARRMEWLDTDATPSAWITRDEVDRVLASIPAQGLENLRDLALIETLWRTALRNSAARQIRLTDLRRQGDQVWLRYQSKGRENRRVFPGDAWTRVQVYLQARGRWDDLDRALRGGAVDPALYLFVNHASNAASGGQDPERRPLSRDWLTHMLRRRTRAALGTEYRPHAFRHGRAHYWHSQGVSVEHISQALDHASVDMTMRYLQSMQDRGADLAAM